MPVLCWLRIVHVGSCGLFNRGEEPFVDLLLHLCFLVHCVHCSKINMVGKLLSKRLFFWGWQMEQVWLDDLFITTGILPVSSCPHSHSQPPKYHTETPKSVGRSKSLVFHPQSCKFDVTPHALKWAFHWVHSANSILAYFSMTGGSAFKLHWMASPLEFSIRS